jgi:predicted nucleotidyltransferase
MRTWLIFLVVGGFVTVSVSIDAKVTALFRLNMRRDPSTPIATRYDERRSGTVDASPRLPDTPRGRRLQRRRDAILEIAARHGASNVRVFGSVARGEDGWDSDLDLLVNLAPGTGLVALAALERELTQLLGIPVDIAPADSLKPRVRLAADRDAIAL